MPSRPGNLQRLPGRDPARPHAAETRVGDIERIVHQFLVRRLEARLGKAEAGGEAPEDLGVRQGFADRRDHRLGALQPMVTVGRIEIGVFEMRRCRQDHIAMRHALGHRQLDADRKHVLARQPPPHPVLVGMHDDRIVIVDKQRAQWRGDVVVDEMAADIVDVERAGACRNQVRALQFRQGLGEGIARAEDDAAAAAELAEQRRQRNCRSDAAAAIAAALEPVAGRQHEGIGFGQPPRRASGSGFRRHRRPQLRGMPATPGPTP